MKNTKIFLIAISLATMFAVSAEAGPRDDIVAGFMAQGATTADPAKGQAMYNANYGTGKVETPKCQSCHGATPQQAGETRTAKPIDPMAVSKAPDRFTDKKKVDKWFLRNCKGVIGRECTAQEKVDFISFMMTQ